MKRKLRAVFMFSFLLLTGTSMVLAQNRVVNGKVTDSSDGTPLPGVNIVLKGSTIGTVTDIDGNYSLNVPSGGGTLVFSSIGFAPLEVEIGNQSTIDVAMAINIQTLSEVVVTGYGTQQLREFAGSAAVVGAADIEQVPIADFTQILQGRVPGMYVASGSGQPGVTGKVLIRGLSSINSSIGPLYILDGVPIESGTFATLNPNDFESVTVLKDASASAIYGSRGANGVVVITSKRGKVGKTVVTARAQFGLSFKPENIFQPLNTPQKVEWELLTGQGIAPTLSGEALDSLRNVPTTDWEDEIFRTGIMQTYEISASGGNEKSRFFTSLNYFSQEGIALSSKLDRYVLRLNLDNEASERFRFGNSLSLGFSRENSIAVERGANTNNPFAALSLLNPYDPVIDPVTGNYYRTTGLAQNVIAIADQHEDIRDEVKVIASIYAELDITKKLTAKTNWGLDYRQRNFKSLVPPGSFSGFPGPNNQGSLLRSNNRRPRFVGTTSLTYETTFNEDHDLSVSLFNELWYQQFEFSSTTGFGLNRIFEPVGTTPGTSANGFIPTFDGSSRDEALLSYFANAVYSYKDRYVANLSVRRDGSSRFGENNQFVVLWSGGLAWAVSDESFLENVSWVDNLKLKVSYGQTGNKDVGVAFLTNYYPSLETYSNSVIYDGVAGLAANIPGNPDLQWETNNQFNTGVEFSLFQGRLAGSLEYYNQLTKDAFVTQQLSRTTGFPSLDINAAEVRNSGFEVSIRGDILRRKDFLLSAYVNAAYNKNEVVDLGQVEEFEQGTGIVREGLPVATHYFVEYLGVNPATGQPIYADSLGNPTSQFSDVHRVPHGTWEAPHFGGFGTDIKYKGIELNVFFSYIYDIQLYNNTTFFQVNPSFAAGNTSTDVLRVWRQPGDITDLHGVDFQVQATEQFLEDGSFLRLRNVTLAYTLPQSLSSKIGLQNVRFYAQGQNLLTFTEYTGLDPENSNNLQLFEFPQPRTVTFGVDIGL